MFKVEFIDILFFFHNAKLAKQLNENSKAPPLSEITAITSLGSVFCSVFFLLVCQGASHFKGLIVVISSSLSLSSIFS